MTAAFSGIENLASVTSIRNLPGIAGGRVDVDR
jgi:hypothetical protein